ncbi:MAG: septum formation initiator family protein [Coriobacteriia bacterium]|nr:septum formation initiator family protein [Coriobacteriia bacterium]
MNKRSLNIANKIVSGKHNKALIIFISILVTIVILCLFLYTPAKNFYTACRENDKLTAQLNAIQTANNDLSDEIEYLQTPEGVKERANQSLGLIEKGESTGVVNGTAKDTKADNSAGTTSSRLAYKAVKAPVTWYSPFCDAIFGYKG